MQLRLWLGSVHITAREKGNVDGLHKQPVAKFVELFTLSRPHI